MNSKQLFEKMPKFISFQPKEVCNNYKKKENIVDDEGGALGTYYGHTEDECKTKCSEIFEMVYDEGLTKEAIDQSPTRIIDIRNLILNIDTKIEEQLNKLEQDKLKQEDDKLGYDTGGK